jgi:hypothetical protein
MFNQSLAEPSTFRETLALYSGLRMIAEGVFQVAASGTILHTQSQTAIDC